MLDEANHAKVCFAIASELLGREVGSGDLPVDDALLETSCVNDLKNGPSASRLIPQALGPQK